jgi:plasmid stabilization system protein ParE
MTLPTVEILPEAVDEARVALEWYQARSHTAAEAFLAELDRGIENVRAAPEAYPPYLHGTRCYLFHRFPYLLVYRIVPSALQVIAVAHSRRRPGYWKARDAK